MHSKHIYFIIWQTGIFDPLPPPADPDVRWSGEPGVKDVHTADIVRSLNGVSEWWIIVEPQALPEPVDSIYHHYSTQVPLTVFSMLGWYVTDLLYVSLLHSKEETAFKCVKNDKYCNKVTINERSNSSGYLREGKIISLALTKHFPSLCLVIWNATTVEPLGHELDNRATAEYTTGFRTRTQRKVRFPVV